MAQHIAGPWSTSTNEGDRHTYVVAADERNGQSKGTVLIARIMEHKFGSADRIAPPEIQRANATLIAAAPSMATLLGQLVRLTAAINARQHAGMKVTPHEWSELYQLTNEASGVLQSVLC